MKFLLSILPRSILIRLSIFFLPLLKIIYKGNKFTDPINGKSYRKFIPYGYKKIRPNALSPGTLSLERHRLLWLYLKRETTFLKDKKKVLHIAPEQALYREFKKNKFWNYTTLDLSSPLADIKADITNLPFDNNFFDLIICNHVLEHIPKDLIAMKEIFRILKKNGVAIMQVPIDKNRLETFEDFSVKSSKKREELFGQYDHVRIYGKDFFDRLKSVGFRIQKIDYTKELSQEEINKFSINKGELIPIGIKRSNN
ncbi:MAG: methyltransferase domain-containing protein [Bacteroidota bacterium]|nr:methyltransferase domain-containing protein [Bacteroidota bacterium]